MSIEPRQSAVVLVEFQEQWTGRGLYNALIKRQLESRKVLENTVRLVEEARNRGIAVVHAPLVIDPKNKKGAFAHLTRGLVFNKNSWRSRLTDGLHREGDVVVTGRYAFDGFTGSDLEKALRDRGIETLFVCGFTTDQCVAKTLRKALRKGFDAFLVSDCTATLNGFLQRRTETAFADRALDHRRVLALFDHAGPVGGSVPVSRAAVECPAPAG